MAEKIDKNLFQNVKFFLAQDGNDKVKDLLKQGGGTREFFFSNLVTHVVARNIDFPEYEQAKELGLPIVKPDWVIYSVKCESMMPTLAFSVEKRLFSQVTACPSQIPPDDRDALWAMITFYGGRCQMAFDSNCTHLLVLKPEGEKYNCALQHLDKVKIVVPEWIVDCIKAKCLLDESKYAPVSDPETQSQSILTPDYQGQTTEAVVNIEKAPEAPSTLLSPESPASMKLKKLSGENNEKENVTRKSLLEKVGLTGETAQNKNKRSERHAAESAKEALEILAMEDKIEGLESRDQDYEAHSAEQASVGKEHKTDQENEICDNLDQRMVGKNGENHSSEKTCLKTDSDKEIIIGNLLSDCVFFISDYDCLVPPGVLNTWMKVIRQNSGEIVEEYSSAKVTHVMCPNHHANYFRKALDDGKRMVTCHWLNDIILDQKLYAPQTPLHLPVLFKDKITRCRNMVICVTGFIGKERETLKNMICLIGAKYSAYLSRSVTHLICKTETSEKFKKAKEWDINCVNARWLGDVMTGGCDYPVNMKRYRTFGNGNELDINTILGQELLEPWKDFEPKQDLMDKKRKLEMLERQMQEFEELAKKPRIETPAHTLEPQTAIPPAPSTIARVVFTGLNPGSVRRLSEKLTALGGDTATSVRTCTHIVASKIMRTIKFLTGISVCRHIVSPQWIDESHTAGRFLDEKDYVLHDEVGEKLYGMSLPESIDRAQSKKLFQGITFFVTANVRPDKKSMAEILDCAGGKLLTDLPPKSSLKRLAAQKTEDGHPAFVCVTCEEDTHMCRDMKMEGIGVHNVEFVLSGILKQQLDFWRYKF